MNVTEFQKKISESGRPVVVDIWAPWCVPCRVTKPILEKLADEYNGRFEFLPVNADDSREVLEQFRIAGIPTVLALRDGNVVGRVTGAQNESGYRAMFAGLVEGGEVKIPISTFDRFLRLGAGGLLMLVGMTTGSWLAIGLGGLLAFFSVYDRCPVWRALAGILSR